MTIMTPNQFPPELIAALRDASHLAVLTGAGVSAESGIPTFRQAQTGLWAQYDPQELATPQAFRRNPGLVWRWYTWRKELVSGAQPNAAHLALARLQFVAPRLSLITQNVDDLHGQAGSRHLIELHGNLMRNKCYAHGHPVGDGEELAATEPDQPPRCPICNSLLRPDVVWFGEELPAEALNNAFAAAEACDLFMVIGTSALVHPAASLPLVALENGAVLVELNPQQTPLSPYAHFVLRGAAGELLPPLLAAAWPHSEA